MKFKVTKKEYADWKDTIGKYIRKSEDYIFAVTDVNWDADEEVNVIDGNDICLDPKYFSMRECRFTHFKGISGCYLVEFDTDGCLIVGDKNEV